MTSFFLLFFRVVKFFNTNGKHEIKLSNMWETEIVIARRGTSERGGRQRVFSILLQEMQAYRPWRMAGFRLQLPDF